MKNLFDEPERKVHKMPVIPDAHGMFICRECGHAVSEMTCRFVQNMHGKLHDVDKYCPTPESAEDKFKRLVREAMGPKRSKFRRRTHR